MGKLYVLDTSVLIHDPDSPKRFEDNTVAIPIFAVMELDHLKTNLRPEVSMAARTVSRFINDLMNYGDLHDPSGVKHPEHDAVFRVIANGGGQGLGALEEAENTLKMDRLIISAALSLKEKNPDDEVILVSKDVNMRILSNYEGLEAEDYRTDRIEWEPSESHRVIKDSEIDLHAAYSEQGVTTESVGLGEMHENEFVVFEREQRVQVFRSIDGYLAPVDKEFPCTGIKPRNIEQRMALDILTDPDVQLITLVGKAGTGKTFLALAAAIGMLNSEYDRILLSKPVVPMGKDIGYLPGDFDSKMEPWMKSFFDNLDQIITPTVRARPRSRNTEVERGWEYLFETGQMEIQALHSIRGRSIPKAFMIIDEAQNLTPHEVKTIITRAAEGTKIVLCGDPYQIDQQHLDQHSNGLVYVTERTKEYEETASVTFTKGERSRLAELAATAL